MILAATTMDELIDTPAKRIRADTPENEAIDPSVNGSSRKRKRSRKVQSDRKFDCTYEGCGKSYSRAEHLYRHQLNRMLPGSGLHLFI